ncbi:MAG: DMT family transporter [Candidatus Midichloria sp.]|nr:MAG: DMT family transporter [Candidatus Midichloria sp.]
MNTNYSLGILLKILNLLLITIYSLLLIKFSKGFAVSHFCFLIAAIAVVILLPIVLFFKINLKLTRRAFKLHVLRALLNCGGIMSWVLALRYVGANEATAISYTIPIFTSILAWFYCEERLNGKCIIGIFFGIIGTLIVLQPSFNVTTLGVLYAAFSACMWACYDVICKKQTTTEHYLKQVFFNFLFTALILLPLALLDWQKVTTRNLFEISIISLLSATNVVVLFLAYKLAPLILLMPFSYLRLLFMAAATYLLFGEVLRSETILGVLIISVSSWFIFWQQHKGKINL